MATPEKVDYGDLAHRLVVAWAEWDDWCRRMVETRRPSMERRFAVAMEDACAALALGLGVRITTLRDQLNEFRKTGMSRAESVGEAIRFFQPTA